MKCNDQENWRKYSTKQSICKPLLVLWMHLLTWTYLCAESSSEFCQTLVMKNSKCISQSGLFIFFVSKFFNSGSLLPSNTVYNTCNHFPVINSVLRINVCWGLPLLVTLLGNCLFTLPNAWENITHLMWNHYISLSTNFHGLVYRWTLVSMGINTCKISKCTHRQEILKFKCP